MFIFRENESYFLSKAWGHEELFFLKSFTMFVKPKPSLTSFEKPTKTRKSRAKTVAEKVF